MIFGFWCRLMWWFDTAGYPRIADWCEARMRAALPQVRGD